MHADVGAQTGHVGPPVVEAEPEPAAQVREAWRRADRGVQVADPAAHVDVAPARPDSGDATMLRTRSCVVDGNRPAAASVSATAVTSVSPRNCTLPRAVSSSVPDPDCVAAALNAASCAAVSMPPGNRTWAKAPSAAWCTCSAPGQASVSRVLATRPRYGHRLNTAVDIGFRQT